MIKVDGRGPAISERAPAERTFVVLDGLRGIAAPLVILYHAGPLLGINFTPLGGYLAVDLFFVLSGFVIAYAYDARLAAGFSPGRFLVQRLIRFYPLYFVSLLIGLAMMAAAYMLKVLPVPWMAWVTMAPEFLFLPGFKSPTPSWLPQGHLALFALNAAAYTLFAELIINFIYAVLWKRLTIPVLCAIVAVSAALIVWIVVVYGQVYGGTFGQLHVLAVRVTFSFFLGALMFRLYTKGLRAPVVPAWLCFAAAAALLFLHVPQALRPLYDGAFILLASPLLVWFGAAASANLRIRTFAMVAGQTSYAAYILHQPLVTIITQADLKLLDGALAGQGPIWGLAFLVGVVLLAWLADVYFDVPVRKALSKRIFEPRKSPALSLQPQGGG